MTRNRNGSSSASNAGKTAAKKTAGRVPAARNAPNGPLALTSEGHKVIKGTPVCALDRDPDTSLGVSLALHLMSEHGIVEALHLDDAAAEKRHRELHAGQSDHDVEDHRFRPGAALELMKAALDQAESVARFLVPAP